MSVFVIAEAGVNHNGDIALAVKLVDAAVEAGADAVKFQTFRAEALATETAPKAAYQSVRTGEGQSQLAMLKALELSPERHRVLKAHAERRGIEFLSTPFDDESLKFLAGDLGLARIKLGSGEVTNGPFLVAAARTGCDVILSTGMSTLDEVSDAVGALAFGYREKSKTPSLDAFRAIAGGGEAPADIARKITLLHCTSAYPAPVAEANLRAMRTMAARFGVAVGLSDHTDGADVPVAAVALGATTIEKHLTMSRSLPGPDHAASLEPEEFAAMVRSIRRIEAAMGNGEKRVMPSEVETREVARKSVVALAPIARGATFDERNLGAKRPGTGLSPMAIWNVFGRTARHDYRADEPIETVE